MAFKPIDPKRDEFRRYLERAGVIEALTKVFVRIVKERPENPMEVLQSSLGDAVLQADNEAYLRSELEAARAEIQRLRSRILAINPAALDDFKDAPSSDQATQEPTIASTDEQFTTGKQVQLKNHDNDNINVADENAEVALPETEKSVEDCVADDDVDNDKTTLPTDEKLINNEN